MRTVLVLPQNDLIWKFMKGLHSFILNWTFLNFLDFYEKNPCNKKKVGKNCFDKQEKSWTYLKIFQKKHKNFKAIWAVLGHSKPKTFSVGQPWWLTFFFFGDPPSPPYHFTAALLRPCISKNYVFRDNIAENMVNKGFGTTYKSTVHLLIKLKGKVEIM